MKQLGTGIWSVGGNQGAAIFFNKVKEPTHSNIKVNITNIDDND